jgi:hypothetical protein
VKKGLLVAVLVGVVFLAGCDFMAFIDDLLGGGGDPGGAGIGGVTFVQIIVKYDFGIEVMRKDGGLEPWPLSASIASIGPLVFDTASNTYIVETPPGSDPYVKMSIQLDESGSEIRDLVVERQMSHEVDTWERIDKIVAFDIPYHRVEGYTTFYRIDAAYPQWMGLELVDYRDWSKTLHTEQTPMYWVDDPRAMQGYFDADPDRYIEIEFRQ